MAATGLKRSGQITQTTRITAVVDRRSLPVLLGLAPGQVSDRMTAPDTAPDLVDPLCLTGDAIGDRERFDQALVAGIGASGATAHIPAQSDVRVDRTIDRILSRERNRIERFFDRLKHFRGISRPPHTTSPPCPPHQQG